MFPIRNNELMGMCGNMIEKFSKILFELSSMGYEHNPQRSTLIYSEE